MPSVREEFITATIEMARAHEPSGIRAKHAAMVVHGNRVIGAGVNVSKTHTGNGRRTTYHAEFNALKRANGDSKGAVLYSFRNGREKWSRPCAECMALAQERGIKLVVSVNSLGMIQAERL